MLSPDERALYTIHAGKWAAHKAHLEKLTKEEKFKYYQEAERRTADPTDPRLPENVSKRVIEESKGWAAKHRAHFKKTFGIA